MQKPENEIGGNQKLFSSFGCRKISTNTRPTGNEQVLDWYSKKASRLHSILIFVFSKSEKLKTIFFFKYPHGFCSTATLFPSKVSNHEGHLKAIWLKTKILTNKHKDLIIYKYIEPKLWCFASNVSGFYLIRAYLFWSRK